MLLFKMQPEHVNDKIQQLVESITKLEHLASKLKDNDKKTRDPVKKQLDHLSKLLNETFGYLKANEKNKNDPIFVKLNSAYNSVFDRFKSVQHQFETRKPSNRYSL